MNVILLRVQKDLENIFLIGEEIVGGKYRFYPPKDVPIIEKELKLAHDEAKLEMRDMQPVVNKVKLIQDISRYLLRFSQ